MRFVFRYNNPIKKYIIKRLSVKNIMKMKTNISTMILSAMFLAVAYVLPFFTGQIPQIGNMLCPMHIPILICGFICGPVWGMIIGVISPMLRSIMTGVPHLFPTAVCMALELAVYGMTAGLLHRILPKKKVCIYISLICAMVLGRVVWGIGMFLCMQITGGEFGMSAFVAGAITNALPGIVLHILLIPIVIMALSNERETFNGNQVGNNYNDRKSRE